MPDVTTSHIAFFAAGAAAGGVYLAALWFTVRRFLAQRSDLALVAGFGLRLALLFALAYAAFRLDATPGEFAAGAGGLVAARVALLRWIAMLPKAGPATEQGA